MGGGNTKIKYKIDNSEDSRSNVNNNNIDSEEENYSTLDLNALPASCYAIEFTSKSLGMELAQRKKGGIVVKHVVEGYQAFAEGIRRGMRIINVDSQDISNKNLDVCMSILQNAPRPVTIVFKDGIFFERKRVANNETYDNENDTTGNKNMIIDEDHALYATTNDNNFEEFSGPVCFFCQAIATCKVCVGNEFQTVCDECRSWRLREQKNSPSSKQKNIKPCKSTFLEKQIRQKSNRNNASKKTSALDFFVEGKIQSKIEEEEQQHHQYHHQRQESSMMTMTEYNNVNNTTTTASHVNKKNVNKCNGNNYENIIRNTEDGIDDATKAMILALQEQDQKEAEEKRQQQQVTDEASLVAIRAIQEQDVFEEEERMRRRKEDNESLQKMQVEKQQQEKRAREESEKLRIREEQMLIAAIQASQLEAQVQEEQFKEIQEPLSWKAPRQLSNNNNNNNNMNNASNLNIHVDNNNFAAPVLGERHCRQRGCSCMQFDEDPARSTICKCRHGEMYHRLDTEAPLARTTVPGAAQCIHCNTQIIAGNGFSGWYNEVQGSNGKLCHVECWEQYKDSISAKCVKCLQPLRKKEGLFSGRYKKLGEGRKIHKECFAQYKVDIGEYCDICGEALLREYVILQDGSAGLQAHKDGKVYAHKDCWHRHLGGDRRGHLSNYEYNRRIAKRMTG